MNLRIKLKKILQHILKYLVIYKLKYKIYTWIRKLTKTKIHKLIKVKIAIIKTQSKINTHKHKYKLTEIIQK